MDRRARRAAVVLAAITWVPLLVLSAAGGLMFGGVAVPFAYDIAAHVRFLVAVPLLVLAELPIAARLREITARFVESGLVRDEDVPRFVDLIHQTVRSRQSRTAELVVLAATYLATHGALSTIQSGSTWHAPQPPGGIPAAGYWYALLSLPVFQFLVFRWLYRIFLWTRFLHRVAQLDLQLTPAHPDGAGGVAFLGKACVPFGLLLFAINAVAASGIANRILLAGVSLTAFQASAAALVVLEVVIFVGPLLAFVPRMAKVRREGLREYGRLASRYAHAFDRKWAKGGDASGEPLLGSADIQSLADMGGSYELITKMRVVPLEVRDLIAMLLPALVPALPLAATVMPVGDIAKGLLGLLM